MHRKDLQQPKGQGRTGKSRTGDRPSRTPATGRLIRSTAFLAQDEERQRFIAGAVFADGAKVTFPHGDPDGSELCVLFSVFVHEDERTFGSAPQLRDAFALLDEIGAVALNQRMPVTASWAGCGGHHPLVKLELGFPGPHPDQGSVQLVMLANQHAARWHHIVHGGLIGITTRDRMQRAISKPSASFADGKEACILSRVSASRVLDRMITVYDWPRT